MAVSDSDVFTRPCSSLDNRDLHPDNRGTWAAREGRPQQLWRPQESDLYIWGKSAPLGPGPTQTITELLSMAQQSGRGPDTPHSAPQAPLVPLSPDPQPPSIPALVVCACHAGGREGGPTPATLQGLYLLRCGGQCWHLSPGVAVFPRLQPDSSQSCSGRVSTSPGGARGSSSGPQPWAPGPGSAATSPLPGS